MPDVYLVIRVNVINVSSSNFSKYSVFLSFRKLSDTWLASQSIRWTTRSLFNISVLFT